MGGDLKARWIEPRRACQFVQIVVPSHRVGPFVAQNLDAHGFIQVLAQPDDKPLGTPRTFADRSIFKVSGPNDDGFRSRTTPPEIPSQRPEIITGEGGREIVFGPLATSKPSATLDREHHPTGESRCAFHGTVEHSALDEKRKA